MLERGICILIGVFIGLLMPYMYRIIYQKAD